MSEAIPSRLRRLARPPVLPGASHRESLENQIAARFGTARKERTVVTVLFRTAVAAGLLAAMGAGASQVPATYQAEVGKRIEIRIPEAPPPGAVEAAVRSIESGAQAGKREVQVRVRVTREPGAGALIRIDASGDTIGMDGIPAAIRGAAPAFANAQITVQPVEAEVTGDVGTLIGSKVLGDRLSDAQVEEAVKRSLADEGVKPEDVQVDVRSDESDGRVRREVRVIVEKKEAGAQ